MSYSLVQIFAFVLLGSNLFGQQSASPVPSPAFDVATIRLSDPSAQGKYGGMRGRQFYATNVSLSYMISFAYELHPGQITGRPGWLDTERFDVVATPNVVSPSIEQLRTMVQKLLANRFRLTFHNARKELVVYAVTGGSRPHKLSSSVGRPEDLPRIRFNYGTINATNATIKDLARTLQSNVLDRPVVDNTAIEGRFDFTLTWSPDEFQYGGRGANNPVGTGPTIFTAFPEQLGLQLKSTKAQIDVMIVDRVEKPTEN
jgi:uncharacterized protein (TIGR03435 family)